MRPRSRSALLLGALAPLAAAALQTYAHSQQRLPTVEQPRKILLWENGAPGALGSTEADKPSLTIGCARAVVTRVAGIEGYVEHVAGVEAKADVVRALEASDQKPGNNQEGHRPGDLCEDEDPTASQRSLDGAFGFFTFRLAAALAAIMGGVGLVLAVIGVYGVVSFSLAQRTHEFGVRMALGAKPTDILHLVLRQGVALAALGALFGLVTTRALSGTVAHLLLGVSATDPITYLAVASLLASVVLLACYIPARRAMRVDPMVALRHE